MKALISKYVGKIVAKLGLGAGGPVAWVASFVLNFILEKAWGSLKKWLTDLWNKREVKKGKEQDKKDQEHYEETTENPTTNEELEDATTDLLNGRNR